jgi:hypothetical protein
VWAFQVHAGVRESRVERLRGTYATTKLLSQP